MWKYWLFHTMSWVMPSFEQIDADLNPSAEQEEFEYTDPDTDTPTEDAKAKAADGKL